MFDLVRKVRGWFWLAVVGAKLAGNSQLRQPRLNKNTPLPR